MEIWKKINNDIDNYEISSFGNVRNCKTKRILKINNKKNGYSNISLNGKTYTIHRLVAFAFIDNPNNKPTVNHIDKNKHNNKLDNLEWATYLEQNIHSKNEIFNHNRGIWKIDIKTNEKIKKYNTIKEAGLDVNEKIHLKIYLLVQQVKQIWHMVLNGNMKNKMMLLMKYGNISNLKK
jgi:hypothetical protein